jgi:hypothetical protein
MTYYILLFIMSYESVYPYPPAEAGTLPFERGRDVMGWKNSVY